MLFDAFISYSTKDRQIANAVCATLESTGIRCWIAPRDILPGSEYGASIVTAIHQSRVMVLVFSSHANASPQIGREVERAVNRGIPVVPLRIEDIAPTKSLEYFIGTVHWLDALTMPMEQHLLRLGEAVKALLRLDAPLDEPGPAVSILNATFKAAAPLPTAIWWRGHRLTFSAVVAAVAISTIGGLWYLRSEREAKDAVCDRLWIERNSFYKSHGYCFQTQRAKDHFSNMGCSYNDQTYMFEKVFSDAERTQILDLRYKEKERGCN